MRELIFSGQDPWTYFLEIQIGNSLKDPYFLARNPYVGFLKFSPQRFGSTLRLDR
ncbi:hypothetical protein [Metallosphaera yellowstonensis]|uniref:hypothetical protein n=1 Tax=Metallosphaera yellowstonensis TaxID=1111107 RepID=UPI000AE7F186|nr:hypothetical protein [Metallosphaera yellowstonensis]